jgi:hypothetical protein
MAQQHERKFWTLQQLAFIAYIKEPEAQIRHLDGEPRANGTIYALVKGNTVPLWANERLLDWVGGLEHTPLKLDAEKPYIFVIKRKHVYSL